MADALKQTIFIFFPSSDLISCVIANNNYFTYTFFFVVVFSFHITLSLRRIIIQKKNYPKGMKNIHMCNSVTVLCD